MRRNMLNKTAMLRGLGMVTILAWAKPRGDQPRVVTTDPTRPGGKLTVDLLDLKFDR
jgi:hypothetical protein